MGFLEEGESHHARVFRSADRGKPIALLHWREPRSIQKEGINQAQKKTKKGNGGGGENQGHSHSSLERKIIPRLTWTGTPQGERGLSGGSEGKRNLAAEIASSFRRNCWKGCKIEQKGSRRKVPEGRCGVFFLMETNRPPL